MSTCSRERREVTVIPVRMAHEHSIQIRQIRGRQGSRFTCLVDRRSIGEPRIGQEDIVTEGDEQTTVGDPRDLDGDGHLILHYLDSCKVTAVNILDMMLA